MQVVSIDPAIEFSGHYLQWSLNP